MSKRPQTRSAWLAVGVFVILACFYFGFAANRYATSHAYGDEPDYYLIGASVWQDGDLDLRNQYLAPDPHIFPGPLTWKVGPPGTESPTNFLPTNGVLFSGPANAIGGVLLVYLLYAAMNLVSLWLLFLCARRMAGTAVAAITIGIAGLTVPLAWHAASLWTEIPALLCVSATLALAPRIGRQRWAGVLAGAALALLPLLHQKYAVLAVGLIVAMLLNPIRRRAWPWLVSLPAAGIVSTVVLAYVTRGRANFTQSGPTADASSAFDLDLNRFFGQPFAWFLDQTRGYLPLAPVWALAIVGIIVLLRSRNGRRLLGTLMVAFLPFAIVYWFGPFLSGDAPPGRETLPMLPALILALCVGIASLRGIVSRIFAVALTVPSVLIGVLTPLWLGQDYMFNNVGQAKLLLKVSTYRLDWADLWPRMSLEPFWSYSRTAVMAALTLFFAATLVLLSERNDLLSGGGGVFSYPDPFAPATPTPPRA